VRLAVDELVALRPHHRGTPQKWRRFHHGGKLGSDRAMQDFRRMNIEVNAVERRKNLALEG